MDVLFPFGFESQVQFYFSVYILSLVLHAFFMTYVLAGSLYLAWATLWPGDGVIIRARQPLSLILRDWMPFLVSAAITAGVAPLLFVQILYRQQFYTANLLLGWRWMVVVPVLIVAFYLLYVVKSRAVSQWSIVVRGGLSITIAGSFVFVAFCWMTNHLLSINPSLWVPAYTDGKVVASAMQAALRLLTWIAGAFPAMSVLAAWQLTWHKPLPPCDASNVDSDMRRLAKMAAVGIAVAFATGVCYLMNLDEHTRTLLVGKAGFGWLCVLVVSLVLLFLIWICRVRCFVVGLPGLCFISIVSLAMLTATAALREIIRVAGLGVQPVTDNVKRASAIGGFELFVLFSVVNVFLIAWCVRLTQTRH